MLTGVASIVGAHQGLSAGWAIGIGVGALVLAMLLGLARKHGGQGQ